MTTPIIPDETAGRAMATHELVRVDPDELREIAAQIHSLAEQVTSDTVPCLQETQAVAAAAAAAFKSQWQPDSKYDGTLGVWDADAVDYAAAVTAVAADMTRTAAALAWIASNFEEAEQAAEANVRAVDATLDGSRGSDPSTDILLPGSRPRSDPATDILLPGTRPVSDPAADILLPGTR